MKFIILFLFIFPSFLFSQDVLINKYMNSSGFEWAELIVVKDGADLRGFKFRDNASSSGYLNEWQGAIVFRNIEFWNDLREGTYIIITFNHSSSPDTDLSDGYVEISSINTSYFSLSETTGGSLALNSVADMVQLMEPDNSNHHTLGHGWQEGGDFLTVTGPKLMYPRSISGRRAIMVDPGGGISDFIGGYDVNETKTRAAFIDPQLVMGIPNADENSDFLRGLREPNWSSPNVSVTVNNPNIDVNWSSAQTDLDNTQGYLLVRYQTSPDKITNTDIPIDGNIYGVGDKLGQKGTVIAVLSSGQRSFSHPLSDINCGVDNTYGVFAYRYGKDQKNKDDEEFNARGRSYNQTSYALALLDAQGPEAPILISNTGNLALCNGETIILTAETQLQNVEFQWYKNNTEINGATTNTLTVSEEGEYYVSISQGGGCPSRSEVANILVVDFPFNNLLVGEDLVRSDTTFFICDNESLTFTGRGGEEIYWFKNDVEIANQRVIELSDEGSYQMKSVNGGVCTNESYIFNIVQVEVDLLAIPQVLNYGETEAFNDISVRIQNQAPNAITIVNAFYNTDYQILNPKIPFTIPASSSIDVDIRFQPDETGEYIDSLRLITQCGTQYKLYLNGSKPLSRLGLSPSLANFGYVLNCETSENITVKVFNNGVDAKTVESVRLDDANNVFSIESPSIVNSTILADSLDIELSFNPNTPGNYDASVNITFVENGVRDSSQILIQGNYQVPSLIVYDDQGNETQTLDFGTLSQCEDNKEIQIRIHNTGNVDLSNLELNSTEIEIIEAVNNILIDEQIDVTLRITPENLQANGEVFTFNFEPCSIELPINYSYVKTGSVINANLEDLDFGETMIDCLPQTNFDLELSVSTQSNDDLSVSSINNLLFFDLSGISVGDILNINNNLNISITPKADLEAGLYEETITIDFAPCGSYTQQISIEILEDNIVKTPESITINEAIPFEANMVSFEILNYYDFPIEILDINNLPNNFELDPGVILPQTIGSGVPFSIDFIYTPSDYEESIESSFNVDFRALCDFTQSIDLELNSQANQLEYELTFALPSEVKGNPFSTLIIPMNISSNDVNYDEVLIDKITFNLDYNKLSLEAKDVEFINRNPNVNVLGRKIEDGKYSVEIDFDQENNQEFGHWLSFYFDVYLGNTDISNININDLVITTTQSVTPIIENASFAIDSICAPNLKLVEGADAQINVEDGEILSSTNQLMIMKQRDLETSLRIYDLSANLIFENSDFNNSALVFDFSQILENNGVYFIEFKYAGVEKRIKILYLE